MIKFKKRPAPDELKYFEMWHEVLVIFILGVFWIWLMDVIF